MTDIDSLRWYLAVADQLSFSRAAKSLGVARQRVSAAVIELAAAEGSPLFVPGDGPTELTDAGRDLAVRARALVDAEDARLAEESVAAADGPTLRIGFVPGVTVTKWTRIWKDRFPRVALEVDVVDEDDQRQALIDGRVDMCFVRLPIDRDDLDVVTLYSELPVVVVPKEHPVSLFGDVTLADLSDEALQQVTESMDVTFDMVAAGVGPVIVPHSIARLHARRDLVSRTVTDAESTTIALAWTRAGTTEHTDEFLGVVRGRSARSSRSAATAPKQQKKRTVSKPATQGKPRQARRGKKK